MTAPLRAPRPIRLTLGDAVYDCAPGESVLEALLRQGADVPYSCRKGVCLSCLLRCRDGEPGTDAQAGLKDSLRLQGYFLACQSFADADLDVAPPAGDDIFMPAEVAELENLGPDVRRVVLRPREPFDYRPGQFINLRGPGGMVRSYSLASLPQSGPDLELHVRHYDNGAMSGWIFDGLERGAEVAIQGPNGACFYVPGEPAQPMLLIGTGTGLAPLLGIVRDALARGHEGPIRLYHGSRERSGLYLDAALHALAKSHGNLVYVPCLSGAQEAGFHHGRADELAFADHESLAGWRVFLCGYPPMVTAAKKRAYLAGAQLQDIQADPFELRDLRRNPRD